MAELWKSLPPDTLIKLIQYQFDNYGDKLELLSEATSPVTISKGAEEEHLDGIARFMTEKPNTDQKDE